MTAADICEKYQCSIVTLKKNFRRTQKSILKQYGQLIVKTKDGEYDVIDSKVMENADALFLARGFNLDRMKIKEDINWNFLVLLILAAQPSRMYRGSLEGFLLLIGVVAEPLHLYCLEDSLLELMDEGYIVYDVDEDVHIMYLRRKTEIDLQINEEMATRCKHLGGSILEEAIKVCKCWIGFQVAAKTDQFNLDFVCKLTQLSARDVVRCKGLLVQDSLFKSSRAGKFLAILERAGSSAFISSGMTFG